MKLYEKDGVYLGELIFNEPSFFFFNVGICAAEAAQLLMRNVNYEIPSLKKQIAKCQQTQTVSRTFGLSQILTYFFQESTRKEADCISNANALRIKYKMSCQNMGIEVGVDYY